MTSILPWGRKVLVLAVMFISTSLVMLFSMPTVAHAAPHRSHIGLVTGTVVALKADNGLYLSRINRGGTNPIEAAKSNIDPYSKFVVTLLSNGKMAFKADNGLYLSRINRGGINPIEAAKNNIDPYSQFILIPLDNGKIALKADNGLYLSRINRGGANPIEAAKNNIDPYSQFALELL